MNTIYTKEQANDLIKKVATMYGFPVEEGINGIFTVKYDRESWVNIRIAPRLNVGKSDIKDGKMIGIVYDLVIKAEVCRMGGDSAEELFEIANQIKRGASLVDDLQKMDISILEVHHA